MEKVLKLFESNKETYLHACDICKALDINKNALKEKVQDLRKQGVAIVSGDRGYKLTEDREEIKQFVAIMKSHAITRLQSVQQLERALKVDTNQISIEDIQKDKEHNTL